MNYGSASSPGHRLNSRVESLEPRLLLSAAPITISGTVGNDTIAVSESNGDIVASVNNVSQTPTPTANVSGIDVLGLAGNDSITTGQGLPPTSVSGGAGDDSLIASGDDQLIIGGANRDLLVTNGAGDTAAGGAGADTLTADGTGDLLIGGRGGDVFADAGGSGDTLNGGGGTNLAQQNSSDSMSNIFEIYDPTPGANSSSTLQVGSSVTASIVGTTLKVIGTTGNDSIQVSDDGSQLVVSANGASPMDFSTQGVTGVLVIGGPGADTLSGTSGTSIPTTLRGGGGDDSLTGGSGFNLLVGGGGSDTLQGGSLMNIEVPGSRADFVGAPLGNDLLIGGPAGSKNFADFSMRTDPLYLTNNGQPDSGDTAAGEATTIMPSVQNIFAGSAQDTVISTVAGSFLSAGIGQDLIVSGGVDTTMVAGPQGAGGDTIISGGGANAIFALNGHADTIEGTSSNDIIESDPGVDSVST